MVSSPLNIGGDGFMSLKIMLKGIVGILLTVGLVALVYWVSGLMPENRLAICLGSFLAMVAVVCLETKKFKDTEGDSGAVAFTDYYDVFKCFSVVIVPGFLVVCGAPFTDQYNGVLILAGLYVVLMLLHIAYKTAEYNSFVMLPPVLLVKIGLSIIWLTIFYQMLNPSGKTRKSRRSKRTMAVFAMLLITPLINYLILDDEGKELVQGRLRGRRFAGAGTLRRMF